MRGAFAPPPSHSLIRRDILVHAEDVVRVIAALDDGEARVRRFPEAIANQVLVLAVARKVQIQPANRHPLSAPPLTIAF
jgi:hypothetical protein